MPQCVANISGKTLIARMSLSPVCGIILLRGTSLSAHDPYWAESGPVDGHSSCNKSRFWTVWLLRVGLASGPSSGSGSQGFTEHVQSALNGPCLDTSHAVYRHLPT